MEEAARLLLHGYSVKGGAHLEGYDDVSNFSKMFKNRTGRSPAFHGTKMARLFHR